MADTIRDKADLLALAVVGVPGGVNAQAIRDMLVSVFGVFGSIIINGGSTTQTLALNTPEVLTEWTADGASDGVSPGYATDRITIDNDGFYKVIFNVSFEGISTAIQTFYLYKGGVKQAVAMQRYTSNNDVGSGGFVIDLALVATDYLEIWVESDKNGDITVVESQFTVNRIG